MHTLVTGAGAQIVVPDVRGDKVMLHSFVFAPTNADCRA